MRLLIKGRPGRLTPELTRALIEDLHRGPGREQPRPFLRDWPLDDRNGPYCRGAAPPEAWAHPLLAAQTGSPPPF